MSQLFQWVLFFACAAAGAVLAAVLTFFVGWYSCRILSWASGDPEYMGLMYVPVHRLVPRRALWRALG